MPATPVPFPLERKCCPPWCTALSDKPAVAITFQEIALFLPPSKAGRRAEVPYPSEQITDPVRIVLVKAAPGIACEIRGFGKRVIGRIEINKASLRKILQNRGVIAAAKSNVRLIQIAAHLPKDRGVYDIGLFIIPTISKVFSSKLSSSTVILSPILCDFVYSLCSIKHSFFLLGNLPSNRTTLFILSFLS